MALTVGLKPFIVIIFLLLVTSICAYIHNTRLPTFIHSAYIHIILQGYLSNHYHIGFHTVQLDGSIWIYSVFIQFLKFKTNIYLVFPTSYQSYLGFVLNSPKTLKKCILYKIEIQGSGVDKQWSNIYFLILNKGLFK